MSLVIGGAIAVLVAVLGRRDDSYLDEVGTVVAFALGVAIAVVCVAVVVEDTLEPFSMALLALLSSWVRCIRSCFIKMSNSTSAKVTGVPAGTLGWQRLQLISQETGTTA